MRTETSEAPTRRAVLTGGVAACAAPLLSGCGVADLAGGVSRSGRQGRAALLLPLSGPRADLGQMLRGAASLGGSTVGASSEIEVLDSGDDAQAAVRAAVAAVEGGAQMIVGPLFSAQARAVVGAVPKSVPVVTLSNDDSLAQAGAFVFGVTPLHSARAVMTFAAAANLPDIGVAVPPGALGERAVAGARSMALGLGATLRPVLTTTDGAALTRAWSQNPPDAVYLPSAGPELASLAQAATAMGAKVMGSAQWSALDVEARPDLDGAVFAAPDPLRFVPFAREMEAKGIAAGIITGLVFDGVEMARSLGREGRQTRRGLTRDEGFKGVLGPYRLLDTGRTVRGLAILSISAGTLSVVSAPAA